MSMLRGEAAKVATAEAHGAVAAGVVTLSGTAIQTGRWPENGPIFRRQTLIKLIQGAAEKTRKVGLTFYCVMTYGRDIKAGQPQKNSEILARVEIDSAH